MSSWFSLLLLLPIAAAVLYVPGGIVAVAARLRPRAAVTLAPTLSVAVVAGTGVAAPLVGLSWGLVPVVVGTSLCTLAVAFLRRLAERFVARGLRAGEASESSAEASETPGPAGRAGAPSRWRLLHGGTESRALLEDLGMWGIAAVLMAIVCVRFINAPAAFSQTYDGVFHINAVRWIQETGNASSLHFSMINVRGTVYPVGWHTLVDLTLRLSGSHDITLATNAVMVVVAALAWTSGIVALTGALTPRRRIGRMAVSVMVAAAPAFPLLGLFWGILYPTFLSTALLPGIYLTAMAATGPGLPVPRRVFLWAMVALGCTGMALAHPATIVIAVLTGMIAAVSHTALLGIEVAQGEGSGRRAATSAVLTAATAAALWYGVAPAMRAAPQASRWPPHTSVAGAVGETITSAPEFITIVWPLAILVLIGFLSSWRHPRTWWPATTHAVVCALYILNASQDFSPLRYSLTGFWYSDDYRLGGFMMVTALPLAGIGASALTDVVTGVLPRVAGAFRRTRRVRLSLAVVVVAALVWMGPGSRAMSQNIRKYEHTFRVDSNSHVLTTDELTLIERLPSVVGPDDVVLVDPQKGGALAYGLTGLNVVPRHQAYVGADPAIDILENHLDQIRYNPIVCPAIEKLGVDYVLDFKGRTILDHAPANGLEHIRRRDGFELVLKQGDAALYRVTACG